MEQLFIGNEKLSLGKRIGKGGEGEVFLIDGKANIAAKLYYKDIRSSRKAKVNAIVQARLYLSTSLVSFPREVLTNSFGEFVGFSMALVDDHFPMHELYSPKSRKNHYPGVDFRFMVRAACNVARAVAKVHASGCVIGDFNHSGALISRKATVALIDADSFQFSYSGSTYLCDVGMPEFTPPELQNLSLKGVHREESSDLFGLAVAIFQLLFMGRHPYAGIGGPESLEDAIKQNCFAYSLIRQRDTKTSPPPGMFTLKDFPLEVSSAFERAFGENRRLRPSAESWVDILVKLESSLLKCRNKPSHYYPSKSNQCLWCEFSNSFGVDMFPAVEALYPEGNSTVELEIAALLKSINEFVVPSLEEVLATLEASLNIPPSVVVNNTNTIDTKGTLVRIVGAIVIMGGISGAVETSNILWLFLCWIGYLIFKKGDQQDSKNVRENAFKNSYVAADKELKTSFESFLRTSSYSEVLLVVGALEKTIALCIASEKALKQDLNKLIVESERKQLNAFLDRYSIRNANIEGVGPSKKAKLRSFGIETAADIGDHRVRAVPGFGEVFTARLVAWRKSCEAGFQYDRTKSQDANEERRIKSEYRASRSSFLTELRSGHRALQGFSISTLIQEAKRDAALMQALKSRAVIRGDLKALGVFLPESSLVLPGKLKVNFPRITSNTARHTSAPKAHMSTPKCPNCGSHMIKRTPRGSGRGRRYFWGCSRYPKCHGTRNY